MTRLTLAIIAIAFCTTVHAEQVYSVDSWATVEKNPDAYNGKMIKLRTTHSKMAFTDYRDVPFDVDKSKLFCFKIETKHSKCWLAFSYDNKRIMNELEDFALYHRIREEKRTYEITGRVFMYDGYQFREPQAAIDMYTVRRIK